MPFPYAMTHAGDTVQWQDDKGKPFKAGRNYRGDYFFATPGFAFETYSEHGHFLFAALLGHLKHIGHYPAQEILFENNSGIGGNIKTAMPSLEFIFHDVVHGEAKVNQTMTGHDAIYATSSSGELKLIRKYNVLRLISSDIHPLAMSVVQLSPDIRPLEFVHHYGREVDICRRFPDMELAKKFRGKKILE